MPEQQRSQDLSDEAHPNRRRGDTVKSAMAIPALLMAMLFPVIGAAAVFLLLRGHDLPGGGFVAGVTMAVAFILQYMARGTIWVEARLRVLPVRWMGIGDAARITVVFIAALVPWVMNAMQAVYSVDRLLIDAGRTLGASDRQILMRVVCRTALPTLMAGATRAAIGCRLLRSPGPIRPAT